MLLQEWEKNIHSVDDYLLSHEGVKNLVATCMLVEAIGEAYKKIDKETNGTLLRLYLSIPWKAVKGIRDHIAHGYFEILQMSDEPKLYVAEEMKAWDIITEQHVRSVCPGFG